MESLGIEDQETILSNLFPDIDVKVLKKMIEFNEKVSPTRDPRRRTENKSLHLCILPGE